MGIPEEEGPSKTNHNPISLINLFVKHSLANASMLTSLCTMVNFLTIIHAC